MSMNSENEFLLDEALAALRADYAEEPPSRIESFLHTRMLAEQRRNRVRLWSALGSVAAVLVLLTWFGSRRIERHSHTDTVHAVRVVEPSVKPVKPSDAVEPVAVMRQPEGRATRKRHFFARAKRAVAKQDEAQAPAPFVAIPYAEPLGPSEQLDIYRVQLPRTTLSVYGLTARVSGFEGPVMADVAVGSDGVVRAVRLVR